MLNGPKTRICGIQARFVAFRQVAGTTTSATRMFIGKLICSLFLGYHARILLMDKILHDLKDPKLWELWYIPYNG